MMTMMAPVPFVAIAYNIVSSGNVINNGSKGNYGTVTHHDNDINSGSVRVRSIGLGTLLSGARFVSDAMLNAAATKLAAMMGEEELAKGIILPPTDKYVPPKNP